VAEFHPRLLTSTERDFRSKAAALGVNVVKVDAKNSAVSTPPTGPVDLRKTV
jgi:hypothetical protein